MARRGGVAGGGARGGGGGVRAGFVEARGGRRRRTEKLGARGILGMICMGGILEIVSLVRTIRLRKRK